MEGSTVVSLKSVILYFGILIGTASVVIAAAGDEKCDGIVIRQSAQPQAKPGQVIQYNVEVHHSGACELSGLELSDYLPQQTELLWAMPKPDLTQTSREENPEPWPVNRLMWKNRKLDPGGSISLMLSVRAPEVRTGWLRNTVCISAVNMIRKCSDIETFVRSD
ncbi:DUF11 domain-containing protein [bacterium]|nr:DUF11 domain-containing protein [bacterium]